VPDYEDGTKSQKSAGHDDMDVKSEENKTAKIRTNIILDKENIVSNRKKQVYFQLLKDEMDLIMKNTSSYFVNKFTKCLKMTETKISNIDINELYVLKQFIDDLCLIMKNKYEIEVDTIQKAFNSVTVEYLNSFCRKKRDKMETILKNEQWNTVKVSSFFQNIVRVVNDLQISDEEFLNFDSGDKDELADALYIDAQKFQAMNCTLELTK
jgi:hypothetical protein